MTTKTLNIPPLDDVVFSQSERAKRISISITPFKPVRVAFPRRISFKKARAYLIENIDWAKKSLDYTRKVEAEHITTVSDLPRVGRAKAARILKARLRELADRHGFSYNRVTIRSQKSRWGSCSERNNISLNAALTRLADELMDYVLLHELLHTKTKNHSRAFWAELDRLVGGSARALDRRLRKHHLGLLTR
jgi:predicted metal-dependent hydrolase